MRKRLAKKITSPRYCDRLWLRYKYGGGPWPESILRVKKARRRTRRGFLACRRTMKLARAVERGLSASEVLLAWPDLRAYIVRGFPPSDRVPAPWDEDDTLNHDLLVPAAAGAKVMDLIKDWLFYFSDRWDIGRVLRMDRMMAHLAQVTCG